MKKTIGILGGMGPMATVDLFKRIVELTKADNDNDHIPVLVDNNTRIPDRTLAILHGGADPRPELIRSAKRLEAMGADLIIMPCNTAHYFYEDIACEVHVPMLNMIAETAAAAKQKGYSAVGVLSTAGTNQSGIYDAAFALENIRVLKPDETEQAYVTALIYEGIKAANYHMDLSGFKSVLQRLRHDGAQALVLGCTELPIAFAYFDLKGETLDPTEVLAMRAIEMASGSCPSP